MNMSHPFFKPPERKNGRFIVLTGIDGAGKSTLQAALAKRNPDWEIGSYDPRTWVTSHQTPQLAWMLTQDPRPIVGQLPFLARDSFLTHMVLAHYESWLWPRLMDGATILMDSFFFRFWAREQVRHGTSRLLATLPEILPRADCTIFLQIQPELALQRKNDFDLCETGGVKDPARQKAAFVQYQEKVGQTLRCACHNWSRRVVTFSAQCHADTLAQRVDQALGQQENLN